MNKYFLLVCLVGTTCFAQNSAGYVLTMADGTVRLPNSSVKDIMIEAVSYNKVSGLAAAVDAKANIANPSLTGAVTTTGSLGYAATAGGTIVQGGNKTTAVTLNRICGQITMSGGALAAGAEAAFTLNNNLIASTDVIIVNIQSVGTAGAYLVSVGAVSNGSCSITISNATTGSLSQALVLNFFILKSVNQ